MKAASADLIALLGGVGNQFVMWDTYTFTLADASTLTYSTADGAPQSYDVVLNLSFEQGAGQVVRDGSSYAQATNAVTASTSASSPLVQGGSLIITPGAYINYPTTQLFGFGRGPWTWEARIQVASYPQTSGNCILDFRTSAFQDGAMFVRGSSPRTITYWDGVTADYSAAAADIAIGRPVEVCVSYDGATVYGFVDGELLFAHARALDFTGSRPLRIGTNWENDADSRSDFKIDEVRVTRGVCLYRASYTALRGAFPRP